jgi:hypothetical protein
MKLVISDYVDSQCHIIEISQEKYESFQTELWEDYITKELGFDLGNIEWFICDRIVFQ